MATQPAAGDEIHDETHYADALTKRFGSVYFLLANIGFIALWVAFNSFGWFGAPFDERPFGILHLILTVEAMLLTIIILHAQNRQTEREALRDRLQLEINIRAEREITALLRLTADLHRHAGFAADPHIAKMVQQTDIKSLRRNIAEDVKKGPPTGDPLASDEALPPSARGE